MSSTDKILRKMREVPVSIRFSELRRVCEAYFGPARQSGTSHAVFRVPWPGDPRINIQDKGGMAKAYQVRQVLLAIDKLERMRNAR